MVLPQLGPPPQPALPQAFGPPPPGVQPGNPLALLASLKALAGTPRKTPEPIYRPGYKPPAKPKPEEIVAVAKQLYTNNRLWRQMIFVTLMWADQRLTGMFPEDEEDRRNGFQEEWVSPILSAERELIISLGSAQKPGFSSPPVMDHLKGWAQRKEDAVLWLRDMEQFKHVLKGNRPLDIDECALFTDYGMYASRDTLNPRDTDCPITMTLIDPSQVHPVYRNNRLDAVYRVYKATLNEIVQDYGDLSDSIVKKLSAENDEDRWSATEYDVYEYWDTWWRFVQVGDTVIIGVTAHEYGDCPWTVQYVGRGNPMFTRTASASASRIGGTLWGEASNWGSDRVSKAVPYLYYRIKNHELYEAIMARVVTGFKKDVNPPTIRYRSDLAAEKPMDQLDASPGASNEAMLNEEKIEALPTVNGQNTSMVLQAVSQDMQFIAPPKQMSGTIDKSNVTGVAQAEAGDAGQHLILPMMTSRELALEQKYDRVLRMLGNFGHLAQYGTGTKKPIIVPAKRRPNGKSAYEFDREIIEKVGTRIDVTFTRIQPRDWPGLMAAAESGINNGLLNRREVRLLATGDSDFDTFYEEWAEEQAMFMATTNPDFQKLNMLAMIEEQILENEGRPQIQDGLRKMAGIWEKMLQPPEQPPQQPGIGGAPQQPPQPGMGGGAPLGPQQPQGPLQAPFPPPPPGGGMSPGVPGQMSYPQLGAGPGSGGQPVGRPY